jgi:hypothetical protein
VRFLSVAGLPSSAVAAGSPFDSWRLLRFGSAALCWMRERAEAEGGGKHLRFSYDPGARAIGCVVVEGGGLPGRVKDCFAAAE